jgi:hypothetical protein
MEVEATRESESTKQPNAFAALQVLPLHCLHVAASESGGSLQ